MVRPWASRTWGRAIDQALAAERSRPLLVHRQAQRMDRLLTAARGTPRYSAIARRSGGPGRPVDEILATFPLLSREELRHRHTDLLAARPGPCSVGTTSGSSGAVTQVFKPRAATIERAAVQRRWFQSIALPPAFDLAMVTVWRGADGRPSSLHDRRVRYREIHVDRALQLLAGDRPVADLIVCSPNLVGALTAAGANPVRISTSFEFPRPARALFRGCPPGPPESPTEVYACGELTSPVAFRFPGCPSFHVNSDAVVVEVLDLRSGEPVDDGSAGRVVVTDLLNTAVLIIRYDIGDIGVVSGRGRCRCGRVTPRLELIGRQHVLHPGARWLQARLRGRRQPALLVELGPDECVVLSAGPAVVAPLAREAANRRLTLRTAEIPPALRNLVPAMASLSLAERPAPGATDGLA